LPPAAAVAEIPLRRQGEIPMRNAERSLAVRERQSASLPDVLPLLG